MKVILLQEFRLTEAKDIWMDCPTLQIGPEIACPTLGLIECVRSCDTAHLAIIPNF